jgi:PAS domain S-box-containing protein
VLSYALVPRVPSLSPPLRSPWWLSLPVLAAAYLGAVLLGLRLVVEPEKIAVFWPASGLALGVLLAVPQRRWPSIVAAWFVAHAAAELAAGLHIVPALAYPAIALGEVTLGASLTKRLAGRDSFVELDRRGLVALTASMTLVAAPLSAVAAAVIHHYVLGGDLIKVTVLWWSAEVVGELVVAPVLLTASSFVSWWSRANRARRIEGIAGVAATVLIGVATFAVPAEYGSLGLAALALPCPLLMILGWRMGPGAVALTTLLLSGVTVWFSGQHLGPFAAFEPDVVHQVLLIQAYLVIVIGPTLLLTLVEREAAGSAAQLREIFDHSSEAIFLLDVRDPAYPRYEALNRKAEEATGLTNAAMRGKTPHELLPHEDADRVLANCQRCIELRRTITYQETLTMGSASRTWQTTLVPIRDEVGEILRLAGFARDLTESHQQEVTRAALEAQLRQAQKMEAIGRLAGGLAHDFNNILTAIIGHGELLVDSLPKSGPDRQSVDAVLEAGRRASALVRQVLTFARRQEQPRTPIQLHVVLEEVMRLARATVPSTIDVRLNLDRQTPRVLADPTQIHQAVMNLISNAAHAMRVDGGVLTVSLDTSVVDQEFAGSHAPLAPGLAVCLTVADTGHGMDADTLEHVYEPFFTTKPVGEGTGLGLPVVMGIVQNHDGGLDINSVRGGGTSVRIFLPAAPAEAAVASMEPSSVTPVGHGQHVLLVDDEMAVADIGARLLESLGYRVSLHVSPDQALDAFLADPAGIDLLFTDLTMPGMTGTTLAREMRRRRPDIPVVIATGVPSAVASRQSDGFTVLPKPYTRHTVGVAVGHVFQPVA